MKQAVETQLSRSDLEGLAAVVMVGGFSGSVHIRVSAPLDSLPAMTYRKPKNMVEGDR